MNSSTPSVVKRRSRYARRLSSVDSTPIESKRFSMVPVDSSAARMPLPGATRAFAVWWRSCAATVPTSCRSLVRPHYSRWSVGARPLFLLTGGSPAQEGSHALQLAGRSRDDPARADPPRWVDLTPAVGLVVDPWTDDCDRRADLRDRHLRAVLRDHLHDEVAADLVIAVRQEVPRRVVRPEVDVDVPIERLELDLLHDAACHRAPALHVQPLRVVDAHQRVAGSAVRGGWWRRRGRVDRAAGGDRNEGKEGNQAHATEACLGTCNASV